MDNPIWINGCVSQGQGSEQVFWKQSAWKNGVEMSVPVVLTGKMDFPASGAEDTAKARPVTVQTPGELRLSFWKE